MTTRPLWETKNNNNVTVLQFASIMQLMTSGYYAGRNQPIVDNKKNWIK